MLIGMIGVPGAGKTTLALGLTLELKQRGYPAIYLEEYATRHIIVNNLSKMNEGNQILIEQEQYRLETSYNRVDRVVVCDSSLWLNHFHMCKVLKQKDYYASNRFFLEQHYDVLFGVIFSPLVEKRGAVGRLEQHQNSQEQEKMQEELFIMCAENRISFIPITANDISSAVSVVEYVMAQQCSK